MSRRAVYPAASVREGKSGTTGAGRIYLGILGLTSSPREILAGAIQIHLCAAAVVANARRSSPLCCQDLLSVCSRACDGGPVLAGVKVVPVRARGAGAGGAPPGPRLRSGPFGAWRE